MPDCKAGLQRISSRKASRSRHNALRPERVTDHLTFVGDLLGPLGAVIDDELSHVSILAYPAHEIVGATE